MRIIAIKTLRDFWQKHNDAEQPLKAWYSEAKSANWKKPADVIQFYMTASILKNDRVIFNIKGNDYQSVIQVSLVYNLR